MDLSDGVVQLFEGATELHDGMVEFDSDGIQKLVTMLNDDLMGLLDKAGSLLDQAKVYNNYSGLSEGMDGSVKFIFMTAE